jgi:hypothetical protein
MKWNILILIMNISHYGRRINFIVQMNAFMRKSIGSAGFFSGRLATFGID